MAVRWVKRYVNSEYRRFLVDTVTGETLDADYAVKWSDDFLGVALNKYTANENTAAPWRTIETNLNTAIGLVADEVNGVAQITLDSDDNAEVGYLSWDAAGTTQEVLSMNQGLIFETRLAIHTLPITGTETCCFMWGLAGTYHATPDTVDVNAWFRVESSAAGSGTILWESDDNSTNDDDNSTGITVTADVYHIYRIECSGTVTGDDQAVKFYIDNKLVGTGVMNALTATTGLVVPTFYGMKAKSVANTSEGSIYIDKCNVWQNRT